MTHDATNDNRIDDAVKLSIDYEAGSSAAREQLIERYTEDSVDEFLAEVERFDKAMPCDPEGWSFDQVRASEEHAAQAAREILKVK